MNPDPDLFPGSRSGKNERADKLKYYLKLKVFGFYSTQKKFSVYLNMAYTVDGGSFFLFDYKVPVPYLFIISNYA